MNEYSKSLDNLSDELHKTGSLSNIIFEKAPPLLPEVFIDLEEQFSITIAEEVKAFYLQMNGCTIGWEYHSDKLDTYLEGYSKMLACYEMLGGFDGRLWRNELWDEKTPEAELHFYKRLKVFDYFGKDNVHCVCLELSEKSVLIDKLWLFRQGSRPILMSVDINGYIDALCLTKGFWGWQYFYTATNYSSADFEGIKKDVDITLANYLAIFPGNSTVELIDSLNKKIKKS